MDSTLFFKTAEQNNYFYDINQSVFSYAHPLLVYIGETSRQNPEEIEDLFQHKEKFVNTPYGRFTFEDFIYYRHRYDHLKSNGFFQNVVDNSSYEKGSIEPDVIKFYLSNIKQITLEVTQACNLKCRYCAYCELYNEFENRKDIYLKFSDVKKLFFVFLKYWNSSKNVDAVQKVDIAFYGGEPLLNFRLIKQTIDLLSKLNFKKNFTFSMTTNGLLLDKHIDFLVENGFNLTISLDGNEDHNQYRVDHFGNSSFDKVCKNILYIKINHPEYFKNKVKFNVVLHDKNPINKVEEFFLKQFDKIPLTGEINSSGASIEGISILNNMKKNYKDNITYYLGEGRLFSEEDINVVLRSVISFLRNHWENSMRHFMDFPFKKSEKMRNPTGSCPPFWKRLFLTSTGEILPCEKIGTKYSYGNIKCDRNVLGKGLNNVAEFHNRLIGSILDQCKKCYNQRACEVCVYSLYIPNKSVICENRMSKKHFQNYLSNYYSFIEKHGSKVVLSMNKTQFE